MDNAFNPSVHSDESVVIDMVPLTGDPDNTDKLIEDFNKRAEQYKQQHGEDSIQSFVVLAYCPPMKLSDRVKQRNINAKQDNNMDNMRDPKLPFHHFGSLYDVSHHDLMKDSYQYQKHELEFKYGSSDQIKGKLRFAVAAHAVKDANWFSHIFKLSDTDQPAQPSVKVAIKHDAIIDTSVGSPDDLAKKVIAVTEAEKLKNDMKNK